jgi:endonuclease-3
MARVAQRLGLATSNDAERIHDELTALIPCARWTRATHLGIIHGRRTCHARSPECGRCAVAGLCPWPGKLEGAGRGRGRASS